VSGPQNAIVGDYDEPTQIPETQVDEDVLNESKKMARYSKSAEYKRLKEFLEARVSFYQNFLPDGRDIKEFQASEEIIALNWKIANAIIKEIKGILDAYAQAIEDVSNAKDKQ